MEPIGWINLGIGMVIIVGAWTNWLNFSGDGKHHGNDFHPGGWFIYTFICFSNPKAYRVFLWALGIAITLSSLLFCPTIVAYFQSSTLP